MSRKGKIGRLPQTVRFKLNGRLEDGESHRAVLCWLNALPEVQRILIQEFDGKPINEPNLTAWKQSGFAEWLLRRELLGESQQLEETAMDFREEHEERRGLRMESFIQNAGLGLGFRYAGVIAEYDRDPLSEALEKKVKVLNGVTRGVVSLQLAEVRSERLQFQVAQQMEVDRTKQDDFEERAWKWAEQPHIKQEIGESYNPKTQEQLVKEQDVMVREVFGLAPGTCVNNSSDEPDMRPRPRYPGEVVRDFGPKYTHTHDGIPFWKPGPGSPGYDRSKVN
ncbi:MAG: hypothetical protein JWR19_3508, partial [Pedosphaera sp.]|nr:hypothetical protein [Pedosphaera sp.]